jgi:uncharacterized protein
MKAAVHFTTSTGYHYIYSSGKKQFLLSTPLLLFFHNNLSNTQLLSQLRKTASSGKDPEVPGLGIVPRSEYLYYERKFKFLRKSGYYTPAPEKNRDALLSQTKIEQNLTQTKQVIFETTEECNLDCVYCTYSKFYYNKDRERKNIPLQDALKLLDLLLKKRSNPDQELAVSFYGGEPLKNFDFIRQIVEYVTASKPGNLRIKYSLTTNGLLLRKHIQFLVDHDFELAISLDGNEFANSFRVLKTNHKPSFTLVTRNIDRVKEQYPEYFEKKIIFLTVRHSRNSLKTIYEHFSARYGKTPILSSITTVGVVDQHKEEFNKTFMESILPQTDNSCYIHEMFTRHPFINEAAEVFERFGSSVFRKPRQLINPDRKGKDKNKYLPTSTCSPFDLRIYMSADGGIYPCEHISRFFELGSVRNGQAELNGEKIAGIYNGYFQKIKKLCSQCFLSENCKECIFNTGVENGPPKCEFFMNQKKFSNHLAELFNNLEKDQSLYSRIRDEAYLSK